VLTTTHNRIKREFFDVAEGTHLRRLADHQGRKTVNAQAVELFLHLGYVPGNLTLLEGVFCLPSRCAIATGPHSWRIAKRYYYRDLVDPGRYRGMTGQELAEAGGRLFLGIVERLYESGAPAVVPLSGGCDSRAVLAALLEVTEAKNIQTYTFGTPHTLDYEIGRAMARTAGVRHRSYDLTQADVTEEKLLRAARLTDGNTDLFQPVYLVDVVESLGTDATVWSGYTGDGVAGSHFKRHSRNDVASAVAEFVAAESIRLLPLDRLSEEARARIETESVYQGVLDIHEEVFFANHVERYSANHLFLNNLRYAVPYMDDEFLAFLWGVEAHYRAGKRLFNRMWSTRYPRFFRRPLKENWGLPIRLPKTARRFCRLADHWLERVAPGYVSRFTNYVSYARKLRSDEGFYRLVGHFIESARRLCDVESRIDGARLLREHREGSQDHSRALTALASLGVIVEAFR
jgi:asparagine synthase (glutamine-hydrolysing)